MASATVTVPGGYSIKVDPALKGQGNNISHEKIWVNHALICYNSTIYDPSYGVSCFGVGDVAKQSFLDYLHSIGTVSSSAGTEVAQHGFGGIYRPEKQRIDIDITDLVFEGWD